MQNIILQISAFIGLPSVDVYFLLGIIIPFGIFAYLGITKIYEILFGLVLGIAIYIVLQFLLINPNLAVPSFISPSIAKFTVGTSIYLIFILSILIPINSSLHIKEPHNPLLRILHIIVLSLFLITFYFVIIAGFTEKVYIYNQQSAFEFLKNQAFWQEFSSGSKIYILIKENIGNITLFSIFFVLYRIIFNDIVNSILSSVFDTLSKMIKKGGGGGGGGGGHDDGGHSGGHDDHGHH